MNTCYTIINKEDNDFLLPLLADPGLTSTRDSHYDGLSVFLLSGWVGGWSGTNTTTAKERGFLYLF
jgi:hypothetical protein